MISSAPGLTSTVQAELSGLTGKLVGLDRTQSTTVSTSVSLPPPSNPNSSYQSLMPGHISTSVHTQEWKKFWILDDDGKEYLCVFGGEGPEARVGHRLTILFLHSHGSTNPIPILVYNHVTDIYVWWLARIGRLPMETGFYKSLIGKAAFFFGLVGPALLFLAEFYPPLAIILSWSVGAAVIFAIKQVATVRRNQEFLKVDLPKLVEWCRQQSAG